MGELSTALAFSDLRLDKVAVKADVEIAVIVPVFRHSVFLADAVISALEQEIAHAIRIVIVNDGCPHNETHRTALTLAAAYPDRIDYVRRANGGLSAARNTGVDYALSRWPSIRALYFLDADNIIEPAALARAYTALMADETVGWVYPDIVTFGSAERHWDYSGAYSALQHLTVNVAEAGSLARSELFRQGCRFDESMKLGFEDWEFWWQGIAAGFVGKSIPFFGFRYRKRPESMLSETERDRASVVSYMRQKHRASLRPKSLLALENREAPRFALLHDANRVDILTDIRTVIEHVTLETIIADLAAASQQPELHHSSRFVVAASDSVLQLLTRLRLDRYVLWWLECEVSFDTDTQVAALQMVPGLEGSGVKIAKMDHSYWQRRDGPLHMMVWGDTTLAACLEDPRDDWILSLLRGKTEPRTAVLRIEVAAELLGETRCPEVLYRYFDFFKSLHGARQLADPRFPVVKMRTIPPRAWTGNIPRTILECGPLFPLLEDDGRDIAFVLPILSHGGVEKVALRMAKEFQRRGFRLHLVVLSERASLNEEWLSVFEDVCFLYDPTFNIWPDGLSEQPQYLGTAVSQWMVEGDSRSLEGLLLAMDAVIGFQASPLNKVLAKLRRAGVATASSLHVIDLSTCDREVGHPFTSLGYEHVYDLIATCSVTLLEWLHAMGFPRDKLIQVPNAPGFDSDPELRQEILSRRLEDPDRGAKLRVIFLGRFDRQKGLDRLAAIIRKCRERKLPIEWRLVGGAIIAGHDDTEALHDILDLVEPALHDPEELAELYGWADVLLLTSYWEGLPLTILEAAQFGVVPLVSRVGAVEEVVEHRVSGMLLDDLPGDQFTDAAVEMLAELADDRALLKDLSRRAAKQMTRSWDTGCDEFISRLEAVIRKNRSKLKVAGSGCPAGAASFALELERESSDTGQIAAAAP